MFGANGDDIILHYGRGNGLKLTATLDENDIPPMNYNNTTVIELTKYNSKAYTRIWINETEVYNKEDSYTDTYFAGSNPGKFGNWSNTDHIISGSGITGGDSWDTDSNNATLSIYRTTSAATGNDNPTSNSHFIIKDSYSVSDFIADADSGTGKLDKY